MDSRFGQTLKLGELMVANRELGRTMNWGTPYRIGIIGNITVALLKDSLELELRKIGLSAQITLGDYDNILQNSEEMGDYQAVIVFWDAANIVEGFHYKIKRFTQEALDTLEEKMQREAETVISNLSRVPLVIWNRFSGESFSDLNVLQTSLEVFATKLNIHLERVTTRNIALVELPRLIAQFGFEKAIDKRFWYSSKAPYRLDFIQEYSRFILPLFFPFAGKFKKVLAVDGDNTLWKGVLGEDGIDKISMSARDKGGTVFEEVQTRLAGLAEKGVLLCLITKNELTDLDDLFSNCRRMTLKEQHFSAIKAGWTEKHSRLIELASEFNLGLDSFVYLDDSNFEIEAINRCLPEVQCFKVPELIHEYPKVLDEIETLFALSQNTSADRDRTTMVRQEQERSQNRSHFATQEDYLNSLNLEIDVGSPIKTDFSRVAQLTQKTNQFNLTTRRYSESEIHYLSQNQSHILLSLAARDRFGEYGLCGLCILVLPENNLPNDLVEIESLMLSCRVLGRKFEVAFFDSLVFHLSDLGYRGIKAKYCKTLKNTQVSDFYDKMGLTRNSEQAGIHQYSLSFSQYIPQIVPQINRRLTWKTA